MFAPAARAAGTGQRALQFLVLLALRGGQQRQKLVGVDAQDRIIIVGDLLLLAGTVLFRFKDDRPDVIGQHRHPLVVKFLFGGRDQLIERTFHGRPFASRLVQNLAIGEDFRRATQQHLLDDERVEKRLHGVEVGLLDGIEHVIVALGAADRHAHERGGHRFHSGQCQLFAILAIANNCPARQKTEREHVVRPRFQRERTPTAAICVRTLERCPVNCVRTNWS